MLGNTHPKLNSKNLGVISWILGFREGITTDGCVRIRNTKQLIDPSVINELVKRNSRIRKSRTITARGGTKAIKRN